MREYIFLHLTEFIVLIILCSIIVNIIFRIRHIVKIVDSVIDDTLKVYDAQSKKRRFSGTKLTMLTAFASIVWSFHYITIKYGFNEIAFVTMAAIATGVSITKAYSKKIDPEVVAPDTQTTIKQESTENSSETTVKTESTNEKQP